MAAALYLLVFHGSFVIDRGAGCPQPMPQPSRGGAAQRSNLINREPAS